MKVLVIQGPNINMLGKREPSKYGSMSMKELHSMIEEHATKEGLQTDFFQSNHEGEIVERIHKALSQADYIVINPAAYTHSSIAIRDALLAVEIPVIEVHISNIYKREDFRKRSFVSDIAEAVLSGFGTFGYIMAMKYIASKKK